MNSNLEANFMLIRTYMWEIRNLNGLVYGWLSPAESLVSGLFELICKNEVPIGACEWFIKSSLEG